jgi:CHAT domain-containing protein
MSALPAALTVFLVCTPGYAQSVQASPKASSATVTQAAALEGKAKALADHGDYAGALTLWKEAMALRRTLNDRVIAETDLRRIGNVYVAQGKYARALEIYGRALAEARVLSDKQGEERDLGNIGVVCEDLGQYAKALSFDQEALAKARAIGDKQGEELDLGNIGIVYGDLGQYAKALSFDQEALAKARAIGDKQGEEQKLGNVGILYDDLGQYVTALDYDQQALAAARATGDTQAEEHNLSGIGVVYMELGQYARALNYDQQALAVDRAIGDKEGEEENLGNIGGVYIELGQYAKALDYDQQALETARIIGDKQAEERELGNIGNVYLDLCQYARALDYDQQALAEDRAIGDKEGEEANLGNIGGVYTELGQYAKALDYDQQALTAARVIGDKYAEEQKLGNIGVVYEYLGQYDKALDNLQQSLAAARALGDRENEALWLNNLMGLQQTTSQDSLAIFWGKQAVNVYQDVRRDLKGLDTGTQKTYLSSKETTYRTLADLLVSQGRLPEAEQVLGLLKEQETFDFVRRDAQYADVLDGVVGLKPEEQAAYADYEKNADQLAQIEKQEEDLKHEIGRAEPTPEQKARLDALDQHLTAASAVFQRFLNDLSARFARTAGTVAADPVEAAKAAGALTSSLLDLRTQTQGELRPVAVYTLVGPNALSVIVVDPDAPTPVAKRVAIKDADVNRLVQDFKTALTDPNADPRLAAGKLYDLLIKPIEPELAAAKPTLILWSLDGALRYIPMAALWDGNQYLVERYASSIFALKAAEKLNHLPRTDGTGLALATTQGVPGFAPLAGADEEAHLFGKPDGIVPGDRLEDAAFSKDAFFRYLEKDRATQEVSYSVVHVASHFDLQPAGDANSSFLLLGDGEHLSVSDMQTQSSTLFYGVDLLVLSACNTATAGITSGGKDADAGGEFEGFSNVLVGMGTESVLASLWEVSDVGTPPLMRAFYQARAGTAAGSSAASAPTAVSKALALQRAQLACLSGAARPGAAGGGTDRSAALKVQPAPSSGAFVVDPARPLAHPYYWAAFVLIGNPR